MAMKRKDTQDIILKDTEEQVVICPLGAGQEVGRSCFLLGFQNKGVMFDCGIHPAHKGIGSLPLLQDLSLTDINVILITHFHLDHCAALPWVVANMDFSGPIFMTHATKNIFYTMMRDILRMNQKDPARRLFNERDLDNTMARITVINFHQTIDYDGIKITPYRAGHVLGAAMFMVEIRGMRCLYTGDYSRVPDRHMPAADIPSVPPHIVIVESTFGTSNHLPREDRERRFQSKVREIVAQGGRCLIPVVALGRAQELLLILEDCWARHSDLRGVPVYQTSGIATKSLTVYQSYIEMMNEGIQDAFQQRNPFEFRHVRHTRGFRADSEIGPCVVLATPSMLQTGLSRELFEAWCEDPRNGVIIADFAVQGTLAKELLTNPREVLSSDGRTLKVRCSVSSFSFSAHADYSQTSAFLDALAPSDVVLCHGNTNEMERLRSKLSKAAETRGVERTVHAPANLNKVSISFKPRRMVHIVGSAAEAAPKVGDKVAGVTVQRGAAGDMRVMAPADLGVYNKVAVGRIVQRQVMPLAVSFARCRLALEVLFEGIDAQQAMGGIECLPSTVDGSEELLVSDHVKVTHVPAAEDDQDSGYGVAVLEWDASPLADCVADAVVSVLLQEQGKPAAVGAAEEERKQALARGDDDSVKAAEKSIMVELLRAQFGEAALDEDGDNIFVRIPGNTVTVDWETGTVKTEPDDPSLRGRVEMCLQRLVTALMRLEPDPSSSHATGTVLSTE